ncbi:MAG: ribonuclease Z [Candidatus Micrarchaeaceae archaeon]
MRIIFLGTSGSTPTKSRGLPSMAIEHNSEIFLFDCGEGTQRQMMQFSVNVSKVKAIFLTHIHGDHTLGLAGLVRTLALNRRTSQLDVFVPSGTEKSVKTLISFDGAQINYRIAIKQLRSGEIYRGRDFSISAFSLKHTTATYGFVFKENDRLKFLKPKIKNLGIKGKMFQELMKRKSIRIGSRTIRLKDVTAEKMGKKIVYATDTRPMASTARIAEGADVLIHESTYADKEKSLAKERFHSTAKESAAIARSARAKRLILIHPSARYKDPKVLVDEAKKVFRNTEIAKDGLVITL